MKVNVLADLDGTIALHAHRLHHIKGDFNAHTPIDLYNDFKPNWDAYYSACDKDEPNIPVIRTVRRLGDDLKIWIVSGRRESEREKTMAWLKKYNVPTTNLIMRADGDFTANDYLKRKWVERGIIPPPHETLCVFEDLNKSVKMWREMGYACFQVAEDL